MNTDRVAHEIEFGKFLAAHGAEAVWGWGTPAGKRRALKRARKVSETAGLAPGVSALELGCGTGLFTKYFASSGAKIAANDISPELIALARIENPGVEFIQARFEDLPGNQKYDAVIGSSVLHHLDLEPALAKCYEVLKHGGVLSFAEPNMLNPQVFAERTFLRNVLSNVSKDETAFVRWKLAATLRRYGFEQILITPFDWLHPLIPEPLIEFAESIGRIFEKLPLIREFSGSLLISCKKL